MNYDPDGSSAYSSNAYLLLKNQGFKVKHNSLIKYNVQEALRYLLSNNLLYMRGTGHAWVADACDYCIDPVTKDTVIAQVHCDWGWGGDCNGYYSGEIFNVKGKTYKNTQYFAVGIE